jgi:hypothetical protein
LKPITALACIAALFSSAATAQDDATDTRPGIAPDIRENETRLKLQRGDFVVVPIPISNPTLESGLVAGAQRLKRVFNIDVETCQVCSGCAKVIACIEDPVFIRKILNHLQEKSSLDLGVRIHNPRAPPQASLFS